VALRQNPDGQIVGSSTTFSVHRRRGTTSTSTYLTWFVPESFEPALMESAALQIRRAFCDRPLALAPGRSVPVFSVTNKLGGTLVGLIQFEREEPLKIEDQIRQRFGDRATLMRHLEIQGITFEGYRQQLQGQVVPAVVRIRPSSSNRILFYVANVPPGYRLEAIVGGTEPLEGDSSTSMSSSTSGADFHCSWRAPSSFQWDDLKAADAQIQLLATKGPLMVFPGQPQKVFSVTNSAGEVFEALLELVGPEVGDSTPANGVALPE
jgi:hypothetical protein